MIWVAEPWHSCHFFDESLVLLSKNAVVVLVELRDLLLL